MTDSATAGRISGDTLRTSLLILLATTLAMSVLVEPALGCLQRQPSPARPQTEKIGKRTWSLFLLRAKGSFSLSRHPESRSMTPLHTNERLTLAAGSRVELLYPDGRKVAIAGPGVVVVKGDGFTRKGTTSLTLLKPIPIAMLKALAGTDRLGGILSRAGTSRLAILSPKNGVRRALPETELSWTVPSDVPAGVPVEVFVNDSAGEVVLQQVVETPLTTLVVPGGRIVPGSVYNWRIRAAIPGVLLASDQTTFRLLTDAEAAAVTTAEKAAASLVPDGPRDDTRERLLGFIYWQHGLISNALDEFRKATTKTGTCPVSQEIMTQLERTITK